MAPNRSIHSEVARPRRWLLLAGSGALIAGLLIVGFQPSARQASAQEKEKSAEQIQDELRKALDSLKKGPDPVKEADKPADLNPVDEMRQAEEALRKAKKDLQADPKSAAALKALEEAKRRHEDAQKRAGPNAQPFPFFAPVNPEDFDKEIQRMFEDMHRQMQLMPLQPGMFPGPLPGMFPGNGMFLGPNRFPARPLGEFRLGLRLERATPVLIDQLDLPADKCLVVAGVMPHSPADKAGVKPNDILLEIGGKAVSNNPAELHDLIKSFKADEKVDVVLMRKGKKETLKGISLPAARAEFGFQAMPRAFMFNFGNPLPPQAFGGGGVSSVSVSINNGGFTIRATENGTKYTIVGVKDDGGNKVTSVEIDEGGKVTKAASLDKLEPRQRTAVEKFLRSIR